MRSTDLDNVLPLRGLHRNRSAQLLQGRYEPLLHVDGCSDVHCCRERIVGGLGHVDVVVWMNGCFAADGGAGELATAVGYDFVYVHVELRALSVIQT